MRHVHIGPSPLALGLLVPCALAAGFHVHLLGRPGDSGPNRYRLVNTATGVETQPQVQTFEGPGCFDEVSAEVRGALESEEPLLLTCTLREKIAERSQLVEELIEARPPGAETVFMPCENSPDAAYEPLTLRCEERGVIPVRAVVNKMCAAGKSEWGQPRLVEAHSLGEWLIEDPLREVGLLEALAAASEEVELVCDFEARKERKLWMVNGTHLALALIARGTGVRGIDISTASEDEGQAREQEGDSLRREARRRGTLVRIAQLHGPMDEALKLRHPGLEGNLDYGREHVIAYTEHPDRVSRVLSGFMREDLSPFIATLRERLGAPAKVCFESGRSVDAFAAVFDEFEKRAADLDAFADRIEVRRNPDLITKAADERAVDAYRKLVGEWMSARVAEQRVERLADALRDAYGSVTPAPA